MREATYLIRGRVFRLSDPRLQEALASVYESPERPRCMCVPGGVEMYVARHAEYLVKRMPGTGPQHRVSCASFEPPEAYSGLGELVGEAIVEHAPEQVEIRTAFPLSRTSGHSLPRGLAQEDPPSVNAPRKRMSLRAVLHFLYDRARFNRWYPTMEGKRTQAVFSRHMNAAAHGVVVKGGSLEDRLYVPEQFRAAEADQIAERRRKKLAVLISPGSDVQFVLALLVGELKGTEVAGYRRRLTVKHMPDVPLYIDDKAWERVERAYGDILQAASADVERKPRVLMAALVYAKREHIYQVDSVSLMLVTEQWIPLDGIYELPLIEALQQQGRSFIKPLKYDARTSAGFPNALLIDAGPRPVPLHVISPFMSEQDAGIKRKLLKDGSWFWETDKPIPDLPPTDAPRKTSRSVVAQPGNAASAAADLAGAP